MESELLSFCFFSGDLSSELSVDLLQRKQNIIYTEFKELLMREAGYINIIDNFRCKISDHQVHHTFFSLS